VMVEVVAVVVARAGKADEAPADHVPVAAINRIAEETLDRVVENEFEKGRRRDALEFEFAFLHGREDAVLDLGAEFVERLSFMGPATVRVERGERLAVEPGRRAFELVSLLLGALGERAFRVPAFAAAIKAGKLPVD